ncbi:hypothetical protein HV346_02790 [Enterobacter sp. RHBSTW-00994]|uniref:hypothetical protein n=1 Tax=Enterobacteriaceae TaxID=543 RepID=UPI0015EADA09|nr:MULTISPECIES: hypothetical protein [Enterobacteriaceae]MBM3073096.1 hypothetical protein [Lelliottia sp. RWM.1]QLR41664.1 hypothetical protein HV346_02790 [Enterobacter sp. RHBSTW-00994]
MMKSNDRHQDQVVPSKPYDGFCVEPVIHTERCRQKVLHEELPASFPGIINTTPNKQRGLI